MTVLRTARLVLRPVESGDLAAVLAYRNDPDVARYQGWPLPYTSEHFATLLSADGGPDSGGWVNQGICDPSGLVGGIALRLDGDEAELGISLATAVQGRGYATEALARLTEHAFTDLGLRRLRANVDPRNEAVIRLLLRANWHHERTSCATYWHRDHWADEAWYTLDRPH